MKACLNCGKEFDNRKGGDYQRKFCSRACYHAHDRGVERVDRVTFTCKMCGTAFVRGPGELRSYRKKHGRDPLYCSTKCGGKGRSKPDEAMQSHCKVCGAAIPVQRWPNGHRRRQKTLCSSECRRAYKLAEHERLRPAADRPIQRRIDKQGYVRIRYPNAGDGTRGREAFEHTLIMEEKLGRRLLPIENVHHKNGQRADNRDENLELWSKVQPPGQRVTDKIAFAIDMLRLYPEYAKAVGVMLVDAPVHV